MTPGRVLVVPHRFRGPRGSGNGGWTAGALAQVLAGSPSGGPGPHAGSVPGPVSVRLSAPPPLEAELPVEVEGPPGNRTATARHGSRTVLTATEQAGDPGSGDPGAVPDALAAVPFAVARAAGDGYAGLSGHPFPECFACGPDRPEGDGLRLRPGPVPPLPADPSDPSDPGGGRVAAAWLPDASLADPDGVVSLPVVWAALDCPGGWSVDIVGRPMVLGTMATTVIRRPRAGQHCVVVGAALGGRGRTVRTATALYVDEGGHQVLLARAQHVWVAVDPAAFQAG